MGRLKGERIDFLLGYYVLITLVSLKFKIEEFTNLQNAPRRRVLPESSLVSRLPQSSG